MKILKRIVVIVLIAAMFFGGWYGYKTYNFPINLLKKLPFEIPFLTDHDENEETVYVTKLSILTGSQNEMAEKYSGTVEAQDTSKIYIDGGKTVKTVLVKDGDVVKEGQLLFEYDQSSIESTLEQTELELDKLKNEVDSYNNQIQSIQKEEAKANGDDKLQYSIQIETLKMQLKENEFNQKSKQNKIDQLRESLGNTEVRSPIDGIIQKVDMTKVTSGSDDSISSYLETGSDSSYFGGSDASFITILSTGGYRVKGKVNELNVSDIVPGTRVIVRSRADMNLTWTGTMGGIETNSDNQSNESGMGMYYGNSDSVSTSYPFYINLDSSDGLMLGQHVLIETDNGQMDKKEGIWLTSYFIVGIDTRSPYVWAEDKDGRIEKREVVLGNYDEALDQYEIIEGIDNNDYIAYPASSVSEGMKAVRGNEDETLASMYQEDTSETESQYTETEYDEYADELGEIMYFDPEGNTITEEEYRELYPEEIPEEFATEDVLAP